MTASNPLAPIYISLEFVRKDARRERDTLDFRPTEYTLRRSDGNYQETRFLWDESTAELLRSTYAKNPDVSAIEDVAARIRDLVPRGSLSEPQIRDSEYRAPVRITLKAQAGELYTLPWELMPLDNSDKRLADLPDTLIRYETLDTRTTPEEVPARDGGRILFAWSSAGGNVPATEHRELIRVACQGSDVCFDPASDELAEVTFQKLNDVLEKATTERRPYTALHLLCHGGRVRSETEAYGLVWTEGELKQLVTISPPEFARLLGQFTSTLRLVNLCACGSGNPGELGNLIDSPAMRVHKQGIQSVIATRFELKVTGSSTFFRVLFLKLLSGQKSLESAFIAARTALFKSASYLDYASMQLFGREADGWDTRPFVLRPYRGLQAFRPEHRGFFFGRNEEVGELVKRLCETLTGERPPFQILAGASGTGKSSVVLAGVVPTLKDRGWRVQMIRPATTSLAALRTLETDESVSAAAIACPTLIVADQLEELFGMKTEDGNTWLQLLWSLAAHPGVAVICTLREDFLARCAELNVEPKGRRLDEIAHEEAHRLFLNRISVKRMQDGTLDYGRWEQIIVEPARRVGISLEPGLLQRLLDDIADEPGVLPLLEFALDALWAARVGRVMTNEAYDALGSVVGALTQAATAMVNGLASNVTYQLRRILLNLVEIQADGTLRRRRPALIEEIRPEDPQQVRDFDLAENAILNNRLVIKGMSDDGHSWLELAHEALGKRWETLKQWAKEESVMLHLRADLAIDAERWTNNRATADSGASYLWRGLRLQDAMKRSAELNPDATQRQFLEASKRLEAERGEPPLENLELQGWGVVAPEGERGDRLLACIDELIRHRCGQQRREVRLYRIPPGMDEASTVRWRQIIHQDPLTRPDERPNYLLILGDIDQISAEFQQELSATLMVGRLAFRREEDYTLYVRKVLLSEQAPMVSLPCVLFASWVGADDRVLSRVRRNFFEPCLALAERARSEGRLPCTVSSVPLQGGAQSPWKDALLRAAASDSPGLLVMASHGKTYQTRIESTAVDQQRAEQGAILFSARESFVNSNTMTLTGSELASSPFMPNGFVLLLANLGAGTPQYDVFMPILVELNPANSNNVRVLIDSLPMQEQLPFIAALPQAILANPDGALGVISCLGPAMTSAFERENKADVTPLYRAIAHIGQGSRVGVAIAALHSEVSALSVEVAVLLDRERRAQILGHPYSGDPRFRANLQLRRQALRAFILLGDPAARLPRSNPVDPLSLMHF